MGAPTRCANLRAFRIDHFPTIVEQFRGDEILVVNDTKVVPARVLGQKTTGGRVEMFFVEAVDHQTIHAMMRGKRLRRARFNFRGRHGTDQPI